MVDYRLFINNGVDAFNTTGKTLSVEEQPKTVSVDFLADAIHSQNELIPKRTAQEVLSLFGVVAAPAPRATRRRPSWPTPKSRFYTII